MKKNQIAALLIWAALSGSSAIAFPIEHFLSIESQTQPNGDLYWQRGNVNRAILVWKQEVYRYQAQERKEPEIETRLKIAQGYIVMGKFYFAIAELDKVIALSPSDSQILALTRRRLGNAYSGIGEYTKAILNYRKSLEREKSLYTTNNLVETLISRKKYNQFVAAQGRQVNSFGSNAVLYRRQATEDRDAAIKYAELALSMSNKTDLSSVRALINWNNVSGQSLSWQQLRKGERMLDNIPFSRDLVFTMLNWADVDRDRQTYWLKKALNLAKTLNDDYLKSYVFLELGYLEEQSGNLNKASFYSHSSQLMAQAEFAHDSLFRAQQLAGRIYQKKGNRNAAITAYQNAIASFDLLRRDSLTIDIEQRINFDSEIEPMYRNALKLLLNRRQTKKADLLEASAIFDKLRLAQLQNYFGDNCFEIVKENSPLKNNSLSKSTALINSIVLDDRVVFILQLDNGKLIKSETKIAKAELVKQAQQWSKELNNRATFEFRDGSILFYDRIIKPFESELKANNTEVLIFVHDGVLRNLPMAALSDGEEFLAQKWASVSSIGLNFTPTRGEKKETQVLAAGIQIGIPGWTPLYNVASEIKDVQNIVGGDRLLDSQFTIDNLSYQLNKQEYEAVHFATHGYFGGTVENSFILAYKQKISAFELEDILRGSKQIPDLLVLSACETALLNERSLLGLAGIAARSGVSTTLGTLWQVQDDEQSKMIEAFYTYLQSPNYNKATALQKVQTEEINKYVNSHPEKWASLALIGNYR